MATHTQDDYLICSEYEEQMQHKSAAHPGFITFQHTNGNHYFAWVNDDKIILRSEAYPDAEKMERGIAAILKNCDLPERYRVISEHGAHFLLLMGGGDHQKHSGNLENHSEIGRSCPRKSDAELHASLLFKGKDFADKVVRVAAASTTTEAPNIAATAATAATAASTASTSVKSEPAVSTTNYSTSTEPSADTGGGMGWMKWLLPLILLAGAFFAWKSCNDKKVAVDTNATVTITDSPATNVVDTNTVAANVATATESIKVKLADGIEINANKGGVEDKLVTFLDNKAATFNADDKKANWYDFDNLNFDLGKSTITAASQVQIDNLVAILKAYPGLKIKVGGYTDRKGNDASNKTLSQSRADAVIAALKAKGANAAQLTGAEGYGEELATVDEAASDEARRVDRRTAVRVMAR
jgi:outer membrane protein OmpA-like peptidoglycan-associated protein